MENVYIDAEITELATKFSEQNSLILENSEISRFEPERKDTTGRVSSSPLSELKVVITEFPSQVERERDLHGEKLEKLLMLKLPVELNTKMIKLSIEEPPQLELKVLPEELKYAFLGPSNTLSVIISSKLTADQEQQLIKVLI